MQGVFKEPIHYQNPVLSLRAGQLSFRLSDLPCLPENLQWHYHKEIEFILVEQGAHKVYIPGHSLVLRPGDVVVFGSGQWHCAHVVGDEQLVYIVLHIDLESHFDQATMRYSRHFSEALHPLWALNYMFWENERIRSEVARIIRGIFGEVARKSKGYEIAVGMHIRQLLLALLRGDRKGVLRANDFSDPEVMKPILEYVDSHITEKIELEQLSRLAGMNYFNFSKFFKKSIGMPFRDYVNRKRIAKAEQFLLTGSQTVDDIARIVGIDNMAHFYKLFKLYNNCTPKQFLDK